jgi:hypothetical protein
MKPGGSFAKRLGEAFLKALVNGDPAAPGGDFTERSR